ncbi:MAG: M20/M25/M40 family metallo-hydrolase, partial [Acidimicrobiia bacterium]|nr:M20/M25/M40 family metallo-hydrolase [Acidimicrobiia bacterium]
MNRSDLASLMERVEKHLDQRELTQLCLDLGNIESPYGGEGEAGQFVYDWCDANDFAPRKVGFIEERFNVVGTLAGDDGESLLFNSHLDTGRRRGDNWILRDPDKDFYHRAWVEDGIIVGDGVINDKGPLAAFVLAARAIRDAGIRLRGDVYLSGVCGEIGQEPVDEFQGIEYAARTSAPTSWPTTVRL